MYRVFFGNNKTMCHKIDLKLHIEKTICTIFHLYWDIWGHPGKNWQCKVIFIKAHHQNIKTHEASQLNNKSEQAVAELCPNPA